MLWSHPTTGPLLRAISQEYEEELAEEEGFKDLETCSAEAKRPESEE